MPEQQRLEAVNRSAAAPKRDHFANRLVLGTLFNRPHDERTVRERLVKDLLRLRGDKSDKLIILQWS